MNSNLITLLVPAYAYSIMWNGYATPYSNAGMDWMSDAVFVSDDLDDHTRALVNDVLSWTRAGRDIPGCAVNNPWYLERYVKPNLTRATNKLARAGYAIQFTS